MGASTFRFSLASLLFESQGWLPRRTETRVVLQPEDNRELWRWQEEHFGLTWVEVPNPWSGTQESEVIAILEPPLAENRSHAFHETLSKARARFRSAAAAH
jgi:nitrogenase molybdenum-iron protein alpha/beta subunit